MHTLGHDFIPPGIHAGGLRYHGMAPLVSPAYDQGLIEAQAPCRTSASPPRVQFARTEGIIPAPESSHAIASVVREANACKESGDAKTILFNLSGHGHFDMGAYDSYFSGKLEDYAYPEEKIKEAMKNLPKSEAGRTEHTAGFWKSHAAPLPLASLSGTTPLRARPIGRAPAAYAPYSPLPLAYRQQRRDLLSVARGVVGEAIIEHYVCGLGLLLQAVDRLHPLG